MLSNKIRLALGAVGGALLPVLVLAQVTAGLPSSSRLQQAEALNGKGEYAEALKVAEEGLKNAPQDEPLLLAKIGALMGLHRFREAAPLALKISGGSPEARYKAGECALGMGLPASAVTMWSALYDDPKWGARAYEAAVKALLAQGKEKDAKGLLGKAIGSIHPPSVGLIRLGMALGVGGDELKAGLMARAKDDPACAELLKIWTAAGGALYVEAPPKKEPLAVALKEKSEEVGQTSLQWSNSYIGMGSSPAPQGQQPSTVNIMSGSRGYGTGGQDKASTEGGKTGTMSNLRRVVIPVSINGAKAEPMVFNSQSGTVFVTSRAVKELKLVPVARSEYVGPGAPTATPCDVVLLKEMDIGGLVFKNVPAKVIDPKTDYWKETQGIVPAWLLRHYGMMYDRRGGKLTLYPPGTRPETVMGEGCFRLKNQWSGGAPYVETDLQGKPGSFLLMDLDLPSTYLSEADLPLLGLTVNVTRYGHRQEVGLFGVYSYGVVERATLGLGPAKIDLAGVRAAEMETGLADWSFGALGRETLDLFEVYLDYPSNIVAFKGYGK